MFPRLRAKNAAGQKKGRLPDEGKRLSKNSVKA
jgi:hypothetical protein